MNKLIIIIIILFFFFLTNGGSHNNVIIRLILTSRVHVHVHVHARITTPNDQRAQANRITKDGTAATPREQRREMHIWKPDVCCGETG